MLCLVGWVCIFVFGWFVRITWRVGFVGWCLVVFELWCGLCGLNVCCGFWCLTLVGGLCGGLAVFGVSQVLVV